MSVQPYAREGRSQNAVAMKHWPHPVLGVLLVAAVGGLLWRSPGCKKKNGMDNVSSADPGPNGDPYYVRWCGRTAEGNRRLLLDT
jgi:hypothetical protein